MSGNTSHHNANQSTNVNDQEVVSDVSMIAPTNITPSSGASSTGSDSEANTAVGGDSANPTRPPTLKESEERGLRPRRASVWGEDVNVDHPLQLDDPKFLELKRTLSGRSRGEKFSLEKELQEKLKGAEAEGKSPKTLDVAWKNLAVRGVGAEAVFADDFGEAFNYVAKVKEAKAAKAAEKRQKADPNSPMNDPASTLKKNEKYLIQNLNGVLRSGEMALVLGRPGAGTTTFLKAITNVREGYAGVDGDVFYADMDAKQAKKYPGQIVFNAEDDTHYPTLAVKQTLEFGLRMKTPSNRTGEVSREEYEAEFLQILLKTLGLEHTKDTMVGSEYVRGVSGGERKRVSIAEVLVNRASVVAWDNSSRGLDASTALEYGRSIRTITDILGCTSFISLYQAGNSLYELFDKVMVIAAGQCIYWGPRALAKGYFEDLGFVCPPGQNVADFLTGCAVKTEAVVREEKRGSTPESIKDFVAAYESSTIYKEGLRDLEDFLADQHRREQQGAHFREAVLQEKHKRAGKNNPYSTDLWTQVKACTTRQYQLMWNDKASIAIKQGSCVLQSVILGSLFYMLPQSSAGLFTRGGTLFFILLFNALLGMSEVTSSFDGRAIMAKHKGFGMYRPSAVVLAQALADFPILVAQVSAFLLPIYFMTNLKRTASAFFTLWIITYVTTLALLAFFRAVGFNFSTFNGASQVSGLMVGLLILYTGYLIPQTSMKPWLSWTRWLNPLYYAFESAMLNEFHDTTFDCVAPSLIPPYGTDGNFACTVAGSIPGQAFTDGEAYLKASLGYEYSHLWRNFGIIIVFWIALVALTAFGVERLKAAGSAKSYLLFRRTKGNEAKIIAAGGNPADEEEGGVVQQPVSEQRSHTGDGNADGIDKTTTIFTWKNLDYTVPVKGGKRQLLNSIQGYTKPGSLTALMGSSGAGKTTLLDVLALRKDDGVVSGDIMVDGRPLGASFQRTTGYVSQMDIHNVTQTVREALEFSALLRQPASVPREEKIAYVDKVIDLLELNDIQNALIGSTAAGLGVEQRKRVTIGVELVAKPTILFLDEPTSGLDGQSSYNIIRFLRKLADAGLNLLITIHQPSALLFEQFDRLLLLAKGGHSVYFGDLGEGSAVMKAYFAKNGIDCPEDANPAEFMIDVVSGSLSKGKDWPKIWRESDEFKAVTQEVLDLEKDCANKPPSFEEDGREYATSMGTQFKLVIARAQVSMWRDTAYIQSKLGLMVGSAFLNSLSFLQLDNSVISLQNRLFSVFQGMFVAPGLFAQIQPRFIHSRSLFEAREKQSKMYHWLPFVVAEILSEVPWLIFAGTLYFVIWYFIVFPVGISTNPQHAGPMWVILILYQIWSLGFSYVVAALCSNEQQAALINPIFLGLMASFSGVLVPYGQITAFWRYWIYYLNPWTYILGAMVFFSMDNIPVVCADNEYARFTPPAGQTCGDYMAPYLSQAPGYILDPASTTECSYCQYSIGNDFLDNVNLTHSYDGARNIGITFIYIAFFFVLVFTAMRIRSHPKKSAKL